MTFPPFPRSDEEKHQTKKLVLSQSWGWKPSPRFRREARRKREIADVIPNFATIPNIG